jgi:WD40 repeat protein
LILWQLIRRQFPRAFANVWPSGKAQITNVDASGYNSSILRSIEALSRAQRIDMRAFLPTLFAARIFVTAVALALSVTATAQELLALTGHKGSVTSVAFSPDGRTIVSGSDD